MRFRGKSIRRKIVALLLVPLVSLTVMWAFATYVTGRDANQLLTVGHVIHRLGSPAEDVVQDLQRERRQSLMYLADRRDADALPQLRQQTRATDESIARLRAGAEDPDVRDDLGGAAGATLRAAVRALSELPSLRGQIENNTVSRDEAFAAYNAMVDPHYDFIVALHALENVELDKQGRALVTLTRARESLSREDALMSAALASGSMSKSDLRTFSDEVAERRVLYRTSLPTLPARDRGLYEDYWHAATAGELEGFENAAVAAGAAAAPHALNAERWDTGASRVLDDLQRMGEEAGERYQGRVRPVALAVVAKAVLAGVLGFVALLVSLIVSFRIGRRHVKDLTRLRKAAHEVSGVRLPSVMRRLAAGEQVDVETEAPRLEFGQDETGQVGQALNTLQRAAIEAAVKQADMRRGVSEVFVNLARRSQVLLHRQLTLLDAMERRTEDTDELADLFRLDHMTTRMRRHAEGLVILSGAAPSRQWRKPVQLMDVVRAAVAEVEDYERIEVRRLPRLAVDGPAVSDLTHLIAELLENATVFSPPHTAVQVVGERVANGFTLEIHDRGLGIAPDLLLDANLRLAETPEFELSDTDRLGLFVVSRLAQRQAVRVSLQPSPYGGTTAVVFIPGTILTESAAGGRGEREAARVESADGPELPALEPVMGQLGGPSQAVGRRASRVPAALDGPVELEPPLGADELDRLDDEDGLFRGRARGRGRRGASAPTGPTHSPGIAPVPRLAAAEQHQQAGDRTPGSDPAPLPRRRPRPPVLVSDHGRTVEDGETRARAGGPARPDPEPESAPRAADESGDGRTSDGPVQGGPAGPPPPRQQPPATTPGGLPRRVRQASLAPQLKTDPAQQAEDERRAAQADDDRDAEAVRARMASLQRGWQRGRRDNEESEAGDGSADGNAPQDGGADGSAAREGDGGGTTAPGTTPGGDGP
ncbi:nitrate- and nitrite sensing domain-containing protein [Streptomyces pinistramenti]|uniref:nitrate- and nitrite sensing domain-containing protein n=1 Tax=Streptomyces pinistramenti TaxID=2884812 RepID=UPI001D079915|nr:nitrate- and nitrite sensing domain-containing protein [Streptomyces pinistramenti]MCB5910617.1 nitrate- and nitrite sensing domain-containing protein [Streptomyces pinistramenti]